MAILKGFPSVDSSKHGINLEKKVSWTETGYSPLGTAIKTLLYQSPVLSLAAFGNHWLIFLLLHLFTGWLK